MRDTIKLREFSDGYFIEDINGIEYTRSSLITSMQKSILDENRKLRSRLAKKSETINELKKMIKNE